MTPEQSLELAKRLYSRSGYFGRFLELCQENPDITYKAVYHLLEMEHFAIFDCFRYVDYNSFRRAKFEHFKKSKIK